MRTIQSVTAEALSTLRSNAHYTRDVLTGRQNWSGSDLQGKAQKYGGSYARQRAVAFRALRNAGGCIVPVAHNRLVSAVPRGVDDFGNRLYHTHGGIVVAAAGRTAQCKPVTACS